MFKEMLENVRTQSPLVHNITNYVTVNDVANMLLACGASPIMADDIDEVEEITTICGGLCLNIGTLNGRTIPAMFAAAKKATALGHPVLLDPVGAGASALRTSTALDLINEIPFTAIRGNSSEIRTLLFGSGNTRGVDVDLSDVISADSLDKTIQIAQKLSQKTGAIVAVTGPIDVVADSSQAFCIRNGHPLMGRVTGSGCQLSALITAYLVANPAHPLLAVAAGVTAMGLCGEIAFAKLQSEEGNSTYRHRIIDTMFHLTGTDLEEGAQYEIRR